MPTITNLHFLRKFVSESDMEKMDHGAGMHKQFSNITFKIIEADDAKVTIQVRQGKSAAENYKEKKRLVAIVHETFDKFFPNMKINVGAIPYQEPPVEVVNPDWIEKRMVKYHISQKQLVADTGVDKTNISAWISGDRTMSQPVKGMFYFYFLALEKAR